MAYTVAQLVTESWYLSGIVAQGLKTPSGSQINQGVRLLNGLLAIKTASNRLIPYFTQYELTAVTGQSTYLIPRLINIETLTFFINNVRFSTMNQGRKEFFGSDRVTNITSLPLNWHAERCLGGSNLFLYFQPDTNYPLEIMGKFSLGSVTVEQDLELTIADFYIEYLRYALAQRMCQSYNVSFNSTNELNELEAMMEDISPPDLTMQKISTLQGMAPSVWGYVNLGRGWTA